MRTEAPFQFKPDQERLESLPDSLVLVTGTSNRPLVDKVARLLQMEVERAVHDPFPDGENNIGIEHNLRNRSVVIIQSTSRPEVDKYIMQLGLISNAAKLASAGGITAVVPYFGYQRQDRKDKPRVPISAAVVSRFLAGEGIGHLITVDLHSLQTESAVAIPWDNLPAKRVLLPEIKQLPYDDVTIVSPDLGGSTRASSYAHTLGTNFATLYKEHNGDGGEGVTVLGLNGSVEGSHCVMVDDIIDTAGTIIKGSEMLLKNGALSVSVVATHGVFSRQAIANLNDSAIERIIVTDTVRTRSAVKRSPKFKVVTVAPIIAQAIYSNHTGGSVSSALF